MTRRRSYYRHAPGTDWPAQGAYLLCARSGRWVGDVIELPPDWAQRGWSFPAGPYTVAAGRFHVGLADHVCRHGHRLPSGSDVAAAWAKAARLGVAVPIRLDES